MTAASEVEGDYITLLREAVCLQALWSATDGRAVGDEAERLLAESIALIAGNACRACWESSVDTYPPQVMQAVGQLDALARSRLAVLQEAMQAETDRHSFLVDQVGWLGSLAQDVLSRLRAGLAGMVSRGTSIAGVTRAGRGME